MVNTYHIVGFLYSIGLFIIGMLLISCDGLYSKAIYKGTWCNVCQCLPSGMPRTCMSVIFKIILMQLVLLSIALSGIQIANIVGDPNWSSYPDSCNDSSGSSSSTYCLRVSNTNAQNANSIINSKVITYNLHNGVNAF